MSLSKLSIMEPLLQDPSYAPDTNDGCKNMNDVEEINVSEKTAEGPLLLREGNDDSHQLQQQLDLKKPSSNSNETKTKLFINLRMCCFCCAFFGLVITSFTVLADIGVQALWLYSGHASENLNEKLKMTVIISFIWALISTSAILIVLNSLLFTLQASCEIVTSSSKDLPERLILAVEGSYVAGSIVGTHASWFVVDLVLGVASGTSFKYHLAFMTVWAAVSLLIWMNYCGLTNQLHSDVFDDNKNENKNGEDPEKSEV